MAEHAAPWQAVAVEGLEKGFRLPHQQVNTLKERLLHPTSRRTYENMQALEGVSLQVGAGEFFGIIGRNGSGKSTLLKCIAGIYKPDSGEITLRGRMAPFIELGVGFNPHLTARDNVLINAVMLGLTPREARRRFDTIIDFAELHQFVDVPLKNYSSGMQVRLAFAVMAQVDADILLIDEVLAVGDAAFQRKCHARLEEMRADGRTILLVTHDMMAMERFCSRAMLIEAGRITAEGDPGDVAKRYREVNLEAGDTWEPASGEPGAPALLDAWFADSEGRRVRAVDRGTACTFNFEVELREYAAEPVFGFALLDDMHRRLFVTDSARAGQIGGVFEPGDRALVSVRFENVLAPGMYSAAASFAREAGVQQQELWPEGAAERAQLRVLGDERGEGALDLPHAVTVQRTRSADHDLALEGPR